MKGDTGTSGWDLTLSSFGGCRLHPLLADRAAEWTGLPLRQGKDMLALLTFEPSSLAVNSYLAEEFLSALLLVGIPVAVITFFSAVVALLYPAKRPGVRREKRQGHALAKSTRTSLSPGAIPSGRTSRVNSATNIHTAPVSAIR